MTENKAFIENYIPFILGIDDTDSLEGMCTTYLGTKLFKHLYISKPMIILHELPFLIRLNPNVPFRTKGNGSVLINGLIHPSFISWFQSILIKFLLRYSQLTADNTNPGLVVWYGSISKELQEFGKRALWDLIDIQEIEKFLALRNVFSYHPKTKRGLIGCLAGIGISSNMEDFTFELLQYRKPPYYSSRNQNEDAIWKIDENKFQLFNCVDIPNKIVKIFPKGLDPVFCGIRGENPEYLLAYWNEIQPQPEMECWMIFKTNQGTDAHLLATPITTLNHQKFLPFRVFKVLGTVFSKPISELGGHISFSFKDLTTGICKKCYAYEPTKEFRYNVLDLIIGDIIEIAGNIRPENKELGYDEVLNIERLKIEKLVEKIVIHNPMCPVCSKRMESAGKNQPFRCKKCKTKIDKSNAEKTLVDRKIQENQVYLPAVDAQRHLTKPLKRPDRNKLDEKIVCSRIIPLIFEESI